ncbi:hypothetical protein CLV72_107349 [Allonocardiopsis opalescens]|uniref:Uncharacterized protein n=1 Tax=Allonocardiopsis opalescens TaxID=1144618 RepID=A0A2T0PZ46_9ACTN|nr:hypothetical protein CLV72_107349 [Allonocardiopsis opalescens]
MPDRSTGRPTSYGRMLDPGERGPVGSAGGGSGSYPFHPASSPEGRKRVIDSLMRLGCGCLALAGVFTCGIAYGLYLAAVGG